MNMGQWLFNTFGSDDGKQKFFDVPWMILKNVSFVMMLYSKYCKLLLW